MEVLFFIIFGVIATLIVCIMWIKGEIAWCKNQWYSQLILSHVIVTKVKQEHENGILKSDDIERLAKILNQIEE